MSSAGEFAERYRKLDDGELLALALQRQQLATAASVALDAELAARNLREKALHEFEDQLREKVEPEPEVTEDELPAPSELPEGWFNDDADPPSRSLASSRPKGVTVGAFVFWLSGIIGAAWGALIVFGRPGGESSLTLAIGALAVVLGLVQLFAGFGLWRLLPWGRKLGETICWLGVTFITVNIAAAAIVRLRGFAVDPMNVISQFLACLWQLLWALYLGSKSTREAFLTASQEGQGKGTS